MNNITIYSRSGCPYCDKIKTILEQRNISFTYNELDIDFTREEFYEEFGSGSTFPRVVYNGELIGGCTEAVKYFSDNNII